MSRNTAGGEGQKNHQDIQFGLLSSPSQACIISASSNLFNFHFLVFLHKGVVLQLCRHTQPCTGLSRYHHSQRTALPCSESKGEQDQANTAAALQSDMNMDSTVGPPAQTSRHKRPHKQKILQREVQKIQDQRTVTTDTLFHRNECFTDTTHDSPFLAAETVPFS